MSHLMCGKSPAPDDAISPVLPLLLPVITFLVFVFLQRFKRMAASKQIVF